MGMAKELVASLDTCAARAGQKRWTGVWSRNQVATNDAARYRLTARA
jgi:hypothetical protein